MEEAIELFKKATAIDLEIHGPDHAELATDYNNLAGVYQDQVLCQASITPAVRDRLMKVPNTLPLSNQHARKNPLWRFLTPNRFLVDAA